MGFTGNVLRTAGLRLTMIAVGVAQAVVLARWLGPEGKGLFATVSAFIGVAGMIGMLGLPAAVTRWAAVDRSLAGALAANARLTGAAAGGVLLALLWGLSVFLPEAFGTMPRSLVLVAALALPPSFASAQLHALLLGFHRLRAYNAMEALERLALVGGTAVLLVLCGHGVLALVLLTVAIALLRLVGYHLLLGVESLRARADLGLLRRMVAFSGRAHLATLLLFLVQRVDVLLTNGILGPERTGVYSVAVQLVDFLILVPAAAAVVLLPRVAAQGEGGGSGAGFTAKVVRHAAAIVTLAAIAVGVGSSLLVVPLFGAAFHDAIGCVWILLPGVWCLALQTIIWQDLAGRDYPVFIPALWALSLAVNVALNLWWLPRLGIAGAASSSTVCYVLSSLLLVGYWLRRFPEVRVLDLVWLDGRERRMVWERVSRAVRS